ncbi:MAG TPA: cytochrome-c oxidase, cbb3-type subunit I [Gemmatimonadaceae bacterium]|nr:cytochrome-c oxidase, cbb3-type subunit I [Gemmatimonadaceae bacterium]
MTIAVAAPSPVATSRPLDAFSYDDGIVRQFLVACVAWGIIGMIVGVLIALQLADPRFNLGLEWTSFGRLRPLHTNAVIFAFGGNAFFCGCYYSTQRLCKARMFSDGLSKFHFWGWQAIILAAAVTLPLGFTQAKEYAELEWPIDIAIAAVWVAFGVNFVGTLIRRRERHLYVALWFYLASIITVAILHIFNNLSLPADALKSYSIYAGVQDAFMQWWYGHNAVAFFLTTPFLGLMYYFMPKAVEGPVFSYRLSILHFWSLVFMYIWAGPHHLHYTALPEWAGSLGMVFSVMLWAPSWGGMVNGLLTLRGAWQKVVTDPILKFFVIGLTAYGMSTFEGPMLSIKSVNGLAHYSDWIIAHVHTGALGWNGFLTFGMIYWLLPRLFQAPLHSRKLAEVHFWIGTFGIILYVVAIYAAGVTQGLMWRAFDETGRLMYPDFIETVVRLLPMYWVRVVGGSLYVVGVFLLAYNILMTWRARPAVYDELVIHAAPLARAWKERVFPRPAGEGLIGTVRAMRYHRKWEAMPVLFSVLVTIAVAVASLFEIIPTFLIKSNVPTIASVHPYTPLELYGRDIYIREGCFNCHSQMIRPLRYETERYGEYSKPGESVYDHPFLWGSKRNGPDLAREGGKYPNLWHVTHFNNPRDIVTGSLMPAYPHFAKSPIPWDKVQTRVGVMAMLGVPYGKAVTEAVPMAKAQAALIAGDIEQNGGPAGMQEKDIVAIVAYMQRLGQDIKLAGDRPAGLSTNRAAPAPSMTAARGTP